MEQVHENQSAMVLEQDNRQHYVINYLLGSLR